MHHLLMHPSDDTRGSTMSITWPINAILVNLGEVQVVLKHAFARQFSVNIMKRSISQLHASPQKVSYQHCCILCIVD